MELYRKYRPKTFVEFIGNDKVKSQIERLIGAKDFSGGAFWIEGPTGTGKTTLAHLIAQSLGADVIELDGDKCSVDAVREIGEKINWSSIFSTTGWRAWIVNEAHAMTGRAVQAWLTLLERLPAKRLVIFTTTEQLFTNKQESLFGEFSHPFISRTMDFRLSNQGLTDLFAKRAQEIAQTEGKDGKPIAAYKTLVQECRNNFRWVLQRIQKGDMLMEREA